MHIILPFLSPPPVELRNAFWKKKKCTSSTVWGLKHTTAQALFTLRVDVEEKRRKKLHKLIPPRTGVVVGCVEAFGKVAQPESLQHRRWGLLHCATAESSPHAFMNLLLTCHYGWTLWQKSAQGQSAREEKECSVHGYFSEQPLFPRELYSTNQYFNINRRPHDHWQVREVTHSDEPTKSHHPPLQLPSLSLSVLWNRNFAVQVSSVSLPR